MIHFLINLNTVATLLLLHAACVTSVLLMARHMPAKDRETLEAILRQWASALNLTERQIWNFVYLSLLFSAEFVLIRMAIGRVKWLLRRFLKH
jgi:hypothetical protein